MANGVPQWEYPNTMEKAEIRSMMCRTRAEKDFRINFAVVRVEDNWRSYKASPNGATEKYPDIRGWEWLACATGSFMAMIELTCISWDVVQRDIPELNQDSANPPGL